MPAPARLLYVRLEDLLRRPPKGSRRPEVPPPRDRKPKRIALPVLQEAQEPPKPAAADDPVFGTYWRPRRRGDCLPGGRNAVRPCPYSACRHSLLVDADIDPEDGRASAQETGEVDELPETCSLDVAEVSDAQGRGVLLRQLEPYFGRTRERVRQIELRALSRLAEEIGEGSEAELLEILSALDRDARRAPRKVE